VREILRDRRTFAAALAGLVLASVLIGSLRDDSDSATDGSAPPTIKVSPTPSSSEEGGEETGPTLPTAVAPSRPTIDETSGLPVVALPDLSPEARATVELIDAGGPFPYSDDGETFLNSAVLLPQRETGYYQVYTVDTPDSAEPTPRRIVTGADGELYWTDDHYESFRRIRR
jgi:ribonuclease T1